MSYTLYWATSSGAFVVEAVLELAGVPFDKVLVDLDNDEHTKDEFKGINPMKQVPALKLPDGTIMTESAAICLYLAETHPESKLFPLSGVARAKATRVLFYLASNVYETILRLSYPGRYTASSDASDVKAVQTGAAARLVDLMSVTEGFVVGPYLLGKELSFLDIYLFMLLGWYPKPEETLAKFPKQKVLFETVGKIPLIVKLKETYKM
ncbi:glutathione S-transferase domain-containing protein [Gonapodya prolifera JEL478]|uniref:Glutathione S-transferase domain-containing protein n=1 Tax=Gonapodya prolifera (strain JEL478) TaxID=1344416 RepID=A0A139AHB3_GONPJ|nr:glutathione S-transferase domain-containing protein [Gonapodya prolifera JEL478]|eukprot:KXS16150.1 glutathione S-transferase domain-containing protein [Gonapodya prolifera JEL478]